MDACCENKSPSAEQIEQLMVAIYENRRRDAESIPTEHDALCVMMKAHERLRELGWRDAMYAPADFRALDLIEAGSTGVHRGHRDDQRRFWIVDSDVWPSSPILFRESRND